MAWVRISGYMVFVLSVLTTSAFATPVLTDVWFQQTDFLDWNDTMAEKDSLWGSLTYEYMPEASVTSYLNVRLANNSTDWGFWAVQNMPLSIVDNGDFSFRRECVDIDLSQLGYESGQDCASLYYDITVSSSMQSSVPNNSSTYAPVTDQIYNSWMASMPFTADDFDAGKPETFTLETPPAPRIYQAHDLNHVEEGKKKCMAGALSRSIDWLNRHHNLGLPSVGQIYTELCKKGVSTRDEQKTYREHHAHWLELKQAYLDEKAPGKIITKVMDMEDYVADTPNIVQQEGGDFFAWLKQEWEKGEDIELAYQHSSGSHIVAIKDIEFNGDGHPIVIHAIDDPRQNHVDGYPNPRKGRIWRDTYNGSYRYYLGSYDKYVVFAVSESIPEPCSLLLFGLGGFYFRKKMKRSRH